MKRKDLVGLDVMIESITASEIILLEVNGGSYDGNRYKVTVTDNGDINYLEVFLLKPEELN